MSTIIFEERYIVGISVRTSNQNQQASEDLKLLWERFFKANIAAQIPHALSDSIYSVYTEYESNYLGEYTTVLGLEVASLDEIPMGLKGIRIPAGVFKHFVAQGDNITEAVVATWEKIWSEDAHLNRAYTADLEVYGTKSQDAVNPEVDIYIALQ